MSRPVCVHCGDELNPEAPGTWREVTGWVQARKGGGAHAIHDPKPTGRYACRFCIDLIRKGIGLDQGSLL